MKPKILCVDCDGTLIATDLLFEGIVKFLIRNPCRIILILFWFVQGRHVLKSRISELICLNPDRLPYRGDFLDFLLTKKSEGWKIFLTTAADERHAEGICSHLKFFDGYFASNTERNLKGTIKEELLVREFGKRGFDYAGDADCDDDDYDDDAAADD